MRVRSTTRCREHYGLVDPKTWIAACGCHVNPKDVNCSDCGAPLDLREFFATLKTMGFCKNCVDVYGRMMGGTAC